MPDKQTPDPDAMYVCLESFMARDATVARGYTNTPKGMELRWSHRVVQRFPQFFAPVGLDSIELADAERALANREPDGPKPKPKGVAARIRDAVAG